MNKNYIIKPNSINKSSIANKKFVLSASRYNYIDIKNSNILYIDDIFFESKKNINLEKNKGYYNYIEIGSINNNTGYVNSKHVKSINISSNMVLEINENDILISTVRTYLGGIGYVTKNEKNTVASKALIVLRKQKITKERGYLFAILRSTFFVNQVSIILNASMYPRMERADFKNLFIPFPTFKNHSEPSLIEKYVSLLVQNIIDKEEQIKIRIDLINDIIYSELHKNQSKQFTYFLPRKSSLKRFNRLDSGLYTEKYQFENHLIENYSKGFYQLKTDDFRSGSTPKTRIFNGTKSYLKWVTPTNISDEGFYNPIEKISMPTTNNLNKDCILFINRTSKGKKGEYVGITCFYDFEYYGKGQHNQGLYRLGNLKKEEMLFIAAFMNSKIMRKICGNISIGSKMKEMKTYDFSFLKFPNFDNTIKNKIATLYYNKKEKLDNTLDSYLENEKIRNKDLGIYQLNLEIIDLKQKLEIVIDKIANEKHIEIEL